MIESCYLLNQPKEAYLSESIDCLEKSRDVILELESNYLVALSLLSKNNIEHRLNDSFELEDDCLEVLCGLKDMARTFVSDLADIQKQ